MDINGVAAVITGGASGLGAATARRLVAAGAKVAILDLDRQAEQAEKLVAELGGENALFTPADVTNPEQVEAAVAAAAEMGPLRIAANCAGIGWAERTIAKDSSPASLDPFKLVVNINLIGTFNVLRLAASAIAKTEPLEHGERGCIVNTASVAAFDGQIGQIAYSASKGGIVGMTLPAARDLSPVGIRVCTIAPGIMDTPLLGLLPEDQRAALGAGVPFPKRLGTPDDFAALLQQICENGYLNGETIRLDGALRMPPK
jgi:NAD(P)-dependent dehydrogenase (short-subunit alcohol dehydrogenase family)